MLDGAVEAARLIDDDLGVAWGLFNRAAVALHAGDLDAALDIGARERRAQRGVGQGPDRRPGRGLARHGAARGRRAQRCGRAHAALGRRVAVGGPRGLAGALPRAPGPRASRRSATSRPLGGVAAHAEAWAQHVGLPFAAALADRAVAHIRWPRATPPRRRTTRWRPWPRRRRPARSSTPTVARVAGGPRAARSRAPEEALAEVVRAAEAFARYGARRHLRGRRAGAAPAGQPGPAPAAPGRRRRPASASLTAREREIATLDRRPADQPRDRRAPVPQREDDRDAPAQRLPEAGRDLARRGGARHRALSAWNAGLSASYSEANSGSSAW